MSSTTTLEPAVQQPPLIPIEHLFGNPEKAGAKISPDGRFLSYLAPEQDRLNVWVRTLGQDDDRAVTHDHTRGILAYFWTRDSKRILYLQDNGGDENFHLFAVEIENPDKPAVDLTPFDGVRVQPIELPRSAPDTALIAMNKRNPALFDPYRLDLRTGELTILAENPGNIIGWVVDRESRLRAAYTQTPTGDWEILVRDSEGDPFRSLAVYANEDAGEPQAFTPDGKALWVHSARDSDLQRLVRLDIATGEETVVDEDTEADITLTVISDKTGELLGAAYLRDRLVIHPFDAAFGELVKKVYAIGAGDPLSWSADAEEQKWVVAFNDDRDPGRTYLVDAATGEVTFLFRPRPELVPEQLAQMQPVQFSSRDGKTLHSYLTLPPGVPAKNLPMVLLVHGGPWARDIWGFQPEVQFLANRGYAVLQVNYRGSTGYGKAFTHAAEHEFAGRMHDDLLDGVEWAVREGYADRRRVAIYGGSYGGYATLVGVTFTPDTFAAAISYVGPSSLVTLIRSFPEYWKPFMAGTWTRYVGDPDDPEQEADMLERSPITRVDAIKTPLMVFQGANDPRVTKQESDQIVAKLKERGVDVEYVVKDDEGHGFSNPENRLDIYRRMEVFFAKHLGGRSA